MSVCALSNDEKLVCEFENCIRNPVNPAAWKNNHRLPNRYFYTTAQEIFKRKGQCIITSSDFVKRRRRRRRREVGLEVKAGDAWRYR